MIYRHGVAMRAVAMTTMPRTGACCMVALLLSLPPIPPKGLERPPLEQSPTPEPSPHFKPKVMRTLSQGVPSVTLI